MKLAVNGRFYAARPTGVQRVARELTGGLCERAEVTLLVPRGVEPPPEVAARARVVRGRLGGHLFEQLELPARRRRAGCDLGLDPANAGPVFGGPRVLVLHDVFPLTNPEWYRTAFRVWFATTVARAARRAARVVMCSAWARDEAVRVLRLAHGRVSVITQGLEPFDRPAPPALVDRVRRRFGLPPRFLLATGGGDARKDTGFLSEVLRTWRQAAGEPPPLLVTGAPSRRVHGGASGRFGVDPAVQYVGHVTDEELHALYTGASVFCFPSSAEGFGRPPLEAMACGTPVVAADYGCAREVLGDAAVILAKRPGPWVTALRALMGSNEERARLAAAGCAHGDRFRWATAVEQLMAVCGEALAERAAATTTSRDRPADPADTPPSGSRRAG